MARRRGRQDQPLVIWPCYFEARLSRAKGRRVRRDLAVKVPKVEELMKAVKDEGLDAKLELKAAHPRFWTSSNKGRVRVVYKGAKEELLTRVAQRIRTNRHSN